MSDSFYTSLNTARSGLPRWEDRSNLADRLIRLEQDVNFLKAELAATKASRDEWKKMALQTPGIRVQAPI